MKLLTIVVFLLAAAVVNVGAQPPDLTHFETIREQNGIVSLVNRKTVSGEYKAMEFDALITQYRIVEDVRYLNPFFYLHVRVRASCVDHTYSIIRTEKVVADKVTIDKTDKPKLEKADKETDIYKAIDMICE